MVSSLVDIAKEAGNTSDEPKRVWQFEGVSRKGKDTRTLGQKLRYYSLLGGVIAGSVVGGIPFAQTCYQVCRNQPVAELDINRFYQVMDEAKISKKCYNNLVIIPWSTNNSDSNGPKSDAEIQGKYIFLKQFPQKDKPIGDLGVGFFVPYHESIHRLYAKLTPLEREKVNSLTEQVDLKLTLFEKDIVSSREAYSLTQLSAWHLLNFSEKLKKDDLTKSLSIYPEFLSDFFDKIACSAKGSVSTKSLCVPADFRKYYNAQSRNFDEGYAYLMSNLAYVNYISVDNDFKKELYSPYLDAMQPLNEYTDFLVDSKYSQEANSFKIVPCKPKNFVTIFMANCNNLASLIFDSRTRDRVKFNSGKAEVFK